MSIKTYIKNKTDNLGAAISATAGAGILGQFPQYLAQYMQRLGGHIDEANQLALNTTKYSLNAEAAHKITEHATDLKEGLEAIANSGTLGKIVEFCHHMQPEIAKRTLENYAPGMTFDMQGITYAAVGLITGYLLYETAKGVVNFRGRN